MKCLNFFCKHYGSDLNIGCDLYYQKETLLQNCKKRKLFNRIDAARKKDEPLSEAPVFHDNLLSIWAKEKMIINGQ